MANKKSKTSQHDWRELHEDLLITIAKKLAAIEDFIMFRAVCRPWRSATIDKHQFPMLSFPWLMLTENENNDYRLFFSPLENKTRQISLPEARGCQCWGSPFGWMITYCYIDQDNIQLHLLNPLTRARIPLPSKTSFLEYGSNPLRTIRRAVIVSFLDSDDIKSIKYLVVADVGFDSKFAFAYQGSDTWNTVKYIYSAHDFIYYSGIFLAVSLEGHLMNIDDGLHRVRIGGHYIEAPDSIPHNGKLYLVELERELHMVARYWRAVTHSPLTLKTGGMKIYKLDMNCGKWKQVKTMGDCAVFLGRNTSFALKASNYLGCKPDCIYFTDNEHIFNTPKLVVDNDMGIFNMKTQKIESLYESRGIFRLSVWVTPTLL